ncbi:MAG TPA: nitrogenase component 1, partial [Peptostreptococcaceae bacterium]|nr:nitrogenase component 1 [Peptostreptococcaceae bacterium]
MLQEDLQNFVDRASIESNSDVILADVNHYRVNELQAADRTLEQVVRYYIQKANKQGNLNLTKSKTPSANIIGIFTLGFHHQHDCREIRRLFQDLGIEINEIIPEGNSVNNLKNLPRAWFNFIPYREIGLMTAKYLEKEFQMPYIANIPMGIVDTATCIREIQKIVSTVQKPMDFESYIDKQTRFVSQAAWFSRS